MIRVLGTKRVLMLVLLVAMNVAMAASVYMFLQPQRIKKQSELAGVNGQISTVQSDINRMQIEFDQLAVQQNQFEKLKEKGFFSNQGRRSAEKVFEAIQKQAGVISAIASIQSGTVEDSEEAQKAEHKILKSPVSVKVDATDSIDVYRYIYLLERFFPGHLTFNKITMARKAEVTGTILRSIASGSNPPLVEADIDMTWRTMIPQSEVIPDASGAQGAQ